MTFWKGKISKGSFASDGTGPEFQFSKENIKTRNVYNYTDLQEGVTTPIKETGSTRSRLTGNRSKQGMVGEKLESEG